MTLVELTALLDFEGLDFHLCKQGQMVQRRSIGSLQTRNPIAKSTHKFVSRPLARRVTECLQHGSRPFRTMHHHCADSFRPVIGVLRRKPYVYAGRVRSCGTWSIKW